MVVVKRVSAKHLLDSRRKKTIFVSIHTNVGKFSASSPTGESTGKYEAKSYKKSLEKDIETLKKFRDYFSDDTIEDFSDLRRIEDIVDGHIGANSLFALESAVLKALAMEKKKQVWQLINPNISKRTGKFPRLVGNCVGGGKHSQGKKSDFQEFLLIPKTNSVKNAFEINKKAKREVSYLLKEKDKKFENKRNYEDAWETSLNEKEILDVLKNLRLPSGVDVAASGFYKRKKYHYQNPVLQRTKEEQLSYISNLIRNFKLFYIEDPFDEEDFESFAKLLRKFPNALIVGDDLTTTNMKRLGKAIEMKSINAIIVKPNQNGSLLEVAKVCELAKKKNIKIIFSHRSGETEENILADLAFGFQAEFLKSGITGKEREIKIRRLIEIRRKLK
jgi:enolase